MDEIGKPRVEPSVSEPARNHPHAVHPASSLQQLHADEPVIASQPTPPATDSEIRARYPANAAFSEGQMGHLRYLSTLRPEEKCKCGWYKRGECPNCKGAQ